MRLALLSLALLATPVAAQTQQSLNTQAAVDHRRADALLNAQYRTTMAQARRAGGRSASLLLASQRAWLKYRDAECGRSAAQYEGGSMQPMQHSACLAQLTRLRTRELKGDPR
ncbi:lysozyme inhibitor LprI family protein [Sphingomonas aerophila]|jgi:uncharacterized protein YecT (DUF1311 family)|uniref:Uncharacterized protein YecT (DUF1311 family) n=1 Tax=Sphingomonas aerophila TaxID=1344948 RepID=A0A7W9EWT6_9SPHN|nr:lysozyme inhibitor LprI family protein [Sphingomonas aerophila]MBB5716062.1 uncharacterized protein YecT (DUF1311 family) [Sphingomonas aerophila]